MFEFPMKKNIRKNLRELWKWIILCDTNIEVWFLGKKISQLKVITYDFKAPCVPHLHWRSDTRRMTTIALFFPDDNSRMAGTLLKIPEIRMGPTVQWV